MKITIKSLEVGLVLCSIIIIIVVDSSGAYALSSYRLIFFKLQALLAQLISAVCETICNITKLCV